MIIVDFAAPPLLPDDEVIIPAAGVDLMGDLRVPHPAVGLVVLAHGSGSTRRSPRNRSLAEALAGHGLATLTMDMLTPAEATDFGKVFDVALLGGRLTVVRNWLETSACGELPVGYFGAGSEAPAALWAAAELGDRIRAVVVRGGRPDLAGERLVKVLAPTLFLTGGHDQRVRAPNRAAAEVMRCEHRITELSIPGHPSDGPSLMRSVVYLAALWFTEHLTADPLVSAISGRQVDKEHEDKDHWEESSPAARTESNHQRQRRNP